LTRLGGSGTVGVIVLFDARLPIIPQKSQTPRTFLGSFISIWKTSSIFHIDKDYMEHIYLKLKR